MVLPVLMELTPGMLSNILANELAPPFSNASASIVADCCSTSVWRFCAVTTTLSSILASSCSNSVSVCPLRTVTVRTKRLYPTDDTSIFACPTPCLKRSVQRPSPLVAAPESAPSLCTVAPTIGSWALAV